MTVRQLRILQYNIRKEKNGTMAPLLWGHLSHLPDIMAIQEPWRNPHSPTTYNPQDSNYHLAFAPTDHTRACFYISKQLAEDSWEIDQKGHPDVATLTLRLQCGSTPMQLQVHNVYSMSPTHQTAVDTPAIEELETWLAEDPTSGHLVLGDFNLHHPRWGGTTCLTQHTAADRLISVTDTAGLDLILPPGTVTWEARGSHSTIDLAFILGSLRDRVLTCGVSAPHQHSSNHLPLLTTLDLSVDETQPRWRWAWGRMDTSKLKAEF